MIAVQVVGIQRPVEIITDSPKAIGCYLVAYDPDGGLGDGHVEGTTDIRRARTFGDTREALRYCLRPGRSGRRPLACLVLRLVTVPEPKPEAKPLPPPMWVQPGRGVA